MLILPLHKPLTLQNMPWIGVLLLAINVFVFAFLQSGDQRANSELRDYYRKSGMADIELAIYKKYIESDTQSSDAEPLVSIPNEYQNDYIAELSIRDEAFRKKLKLGFGFADANDFSAWKSKQQLFESLQARIFTNRYLLRYNEFSPVRMLTATFLHAGIGHLLGNMFFLLVLSLLVEGVMSRWLFLALYLTGGFGASAAALLWNFGESGAALGASGAIAALMGAFCVLWGMRKVRVFYWIFVVFDYVRVPALTLLPVWLGWEIYNLLANPDAGIGFDAHAGGLVTGALCAWLVRAFGGSRAAYMDEDAIDTSAQKWQLARQQLGSMQLHAAESNLADLLATEPHRLDYLLAAYRCADLAKNSTTALSRALQLLSLPASSSLELAEQLGIACKYAPMLSQSLVEALLHAAASRGLSSDAVSLLNKLSESKNVTSSALAAAWFELALAAINRHESKIAQMALQTLVEKFGDYPQAQKAKVLLSNAI